MRTWPGETTVNAPAKFGPWVPTTFGCTGCLASRCHTGQSKEYDANANTLQAIDKLPEILVLGQKNSRDRIGPVQNLVVADPWLHLRHVCDFVPLRSETFDDLAINAFVGQEVQLECSAMGYTTSARRA